MSGGDESKSKYFAPQKQLLAERVSSTIIQGYSKAMSRQGGKNGDDLQGQASKQGTCSSVLYKCKKCGDVGCKQNACPNCTFTNNKCAKCGTAGGSNMEMLK